MAFSDAFARGYAIGDSMKKRRAATAFFGKFKELSANADYDPEDDMQAIKLEGPKGEIAALPLESPVAPPSTPGAQAPTSPALPPSEARALPASEIPDAPQRTAMDLPTARQALPLAGPQEIKVTAPGLPEKGKKKARSFTQDDLKELDSLALAAAEAAGDSQVYDALKQTTDSFIRSKIQKNLGLASTALTNDDVDATEKYLKRAYRFVPNGEDLKITRDKDGRLMVPSPWEDGDKIPMTPETITYMGMQLHDPEKFAELMQRERHYRGQQKVAEGQLKVSERQATTQETMTGAQIKDMAARIGISQQELGIKGREQSLKEVNARVSRFTEFQQGLYYEALANRVTAENKAGGSKSPGDLLDEAVKVGSEVDDQFSRYTTAPKNPITGLPDVNWKKPDNLAGLSDPQIQEAGGWAQAIGLTNMGEVSPGTAVQAGLALVRATTPNAEGTGTLGDVDIDAVNGVMYFDQAGTRVPVKLPANMIQALAAQQQQQQAAAQRAGAAGLPPPIPFNNPVAPPGALPLGPPPPQRALGPP